MEINQRENIFKGKLIQRKKLSVKSVHYQMAKWSLTLGIKDIIKNHTQIHVVAIKYIILTP